MNSLSPHARKRICIKTNTIKRYQLSIASPELQSGLGSRQPVPKGAEKFELDKVYCVTLHITDHNLESSTMSKSHPPHPGNFVRDNVIPENMSIKEAAERIGIGRPALSNFLNGKASLSNKMAARLEKAFGANLDELLSLQQAYEDFEAAEVGRSLVVREYVPVFLRLTSKDLELWAQTLDASKDLPALVRRLVNSTGSGVTRSDFPAGENSQQHGWDGTVTNTDAHAWIPLGESRWEFGRNADYRQKANSDFRTRTKTISEKERVETTFVFVTPRVWKEKEEWASKKIAEGKWKNVVALDADDLEQWLETSLQTQVWLAPLLGKETDGCFSLPDTWNRWSRLADPPISPFLFESEIEAHFETIVDWVKGDEDSPLVLCASSKEEALAFLAAATLLEPKLTCLGDNAIVFTDEKAVIRLRHFLGNLIPVTFSGDVERVVASVQENNRRIVISERRHNKSDIRIFVDLPTWECFEKAADEMGLPEAEADVLGRASGRSPTILRRLIGSSPNLRKPAWAADTENIRRMVPLVLAGAWSVARKGDKEILEYLSEQTYATLERWIAELATLDDAPVWSESSSRGVVSRRECLTAIADHVCADDLDRFFDMAEYVLGEDNPALDLEKDQRWAAAIFHKSRDHSGIIRESLSDNLILVAIHGQELFGTRMGYPVIAKANRLVENLLKDGTPRSWLSSQRELPRLAEAAPETFLDIIEGEFRDGEPAFSVLFEPADTGPMGSCDRTGMLWALELLAWNPEFLIRSIDILAKFCQFKLEDNWANKPAGSIRDILLCWRPHTTASIEHRHKVIKRLFERAPDVGWDFCMDQLSPFSSMTSGTYKPRWRGYSAGWKKTLTYGEISETKLFCLNLVLGLEKYDLASLQDLIKLFRTLPDKDRKTVVGLVEKWFAASPSNDEIAALRNEVRSNVLSRRVRKAKGRDSDSHKDGKALMELLAPTDLLEKHRWLFANHWIDFSADEIEDDEDINHEERRRKLEEARVSAIKEVLAERGFDGVRMLATFGDTARLIGWMLGRYIFDEKKVVDTCGQLLGEAKNGDEKAAEMLRGIFIQCDDTGLIETAKNVIEVTGIGQDRDAMLELLGYLPFKPVVWEFAETFDQDFSNKYWSNVDAEWGNHSSEDINLAVRRLLATDRPRAAFGFARLDIEKLESDTLVKLLFDLATKDTEPDLELRPESHSLQKAMERLNERDDTTRLERARLEQLYVRAIGNYSGYRFPNLSEEVAESPLLYFQLVAMSYVRKDRGKDPESLGIPSDEEGARNGAELAHYILDYVSFAHPLDTTGEIDSKKLCEWVREVRALAKEHDRAAVTDIKLGEHFQKCPPSSDDSWPCAAVRDALEEAQSNDIKDGFAIAIHNARGMHARPDHGGPERELAEKYRQMVDSYIAECPFTASILLDVANQYEAEAKHYDAEGRAKKRLRH